MSTDDLTLYYGDRKPEAQKFDLTEPIARSGEEQFACILRNRSGFDAGEIDYRLRHGSVEEHEYQDLANTAFALYESVVRMTGVRAHRDAPKETNDE